MKVLEFYGSSDDTFGEYGLTNEDVDNCASYKPIMCKLVSTDGEMVVIGQYDRFRNGCWDIGVSQVDKHTPIPNWRMEFCTASNGYSSLLRLVVPYDTRLIWYNNMEPVKVR